MDGEPELKTSISMQESKDLLEKLLGPGLTFGDKMTYFHKTHTREYLLEGLVSNGNLVRHIKDVVHVTDEQFLQHREDVFYWAKMLIDISPFDVKDDALLVTQLKLSLVKHATPS